MRSHKEFLQILNERLNYIMPLKFEEWNEHSFDAIEFEDKTKEFAWLEFSFLEGFPNGISLQETVASIIIQTAVESGYIVTSRKKD
jgi:hypothetical protein